MAPFKINTQIINKALYSRMLHFWFEDLPADSALATESLLFKWMGLGTASDRAAFDSRCRASFSSALESIGPANWKIPAAPTWEAEQAVRDELAAPFLADNEAFPTHESNKAPEVGQQDMASQNALALLILLDQMPRNVFRDEAAGVVYSHYDRLARAVAHAIRKMPDRMDHGAAVRGRPVIRMWFNMPLMHSEWVEDHELLESETKDMQRLAESGDNDGVKAFVGRFADSVERHGGLVRQFGRYPYRNEVLGRESTEEEIKYLKEGGMTFGVKTKHSKEKEEE